MDADRPVKTIRHWASWYIRSNPLVRFCQRARQVVLDAADHADHVPPAPAKSLLNASASVSSTDNVSVAVPDACRHPLSLTQFPLPTSVLTVLVSVSSKLDVAPVIPQAVVAGSSVVNAHVASPWLRTEVPDCVNAHVEAL